MKIILEKIINIGFYIIFLLVYINGMLYIFDQETIFNKQISIPIYLRITLFILHIWVLLYILKLKQKK